MCAKPVLFSLAALALAAGISSTAFAERYYVRLNKQTTNGLWIGFHADVMPGAAPSKVTADSIWGLPITQQWFGQFGRGTLADDQGWGPSLSEVATATTNNTDLVVQLNNAPVELYTSRPYAVGRSAVHGLRSGTATLTARPGQCSIKIVLKKHEVNCQQPPDVIVASGPLSGGAAFITVLNDAGWFVRRFSC